MRYFYLLRLHHWPKNTFVFVPAFFAGVLNDWSLIFILSQGVVCFGLVSSAVYIFNDYRDRENDALHPVKKNRPLASGKIATAMAIAILFLLLAIAIPWGFALSTAFGISLAAYLVINVMYSIGLKNVAIVDTLIVASGFLIRTVSGGLLAQVAISQWLVIMVFLLSYFLAMGKRRDDLVLFQQGQVPLRTSSKNYSIEFVNTVLSLLAGVII